MLNSIRMNNKLYMSHMPYTTYTAHTSKQIGKDNALVGFDAGWNILN